MQGYTRRQLKEDKFAETTQGALEWASGHRQSLVVTVAIIAVAVLATIGAFAWQAHRNEQANIALSAALRTFSAPITPAGAAPTGETGQSYHSIAERAQAAEKQFKATSDDYRFTKAGTMAGYLQGVAATQAGDNAAAEQQLKAASEARDKDIASLAKMALASLYRSMNRQSDAVRIYKDVADHPTDTVPKSSAQLELAGLYEATDPQQATNIYQEIQKEEPNSPAAQLASSKLQAAKRQGH